MWPARHFEFETPGLHHYFFRIRRTEESQPVHGTADEGRGQRGPLLQLLSPQNFAGSQKEPHSRCPNTRCARSQPQRPRDSRQGRFQRHPLRPQGHRTARHDQ